MEINIPTEKLDEFKSFLAKKLYEETGILYSEDDIYIYVIRMVIILYMGKH